MKSGDLVFYKDFVYPDGTKNDKYLVLLNTPVDSDDWCLFIPATKRSRGRPKAEGCQKEYQSFFIPKGAKEYFWEPTWLPLDPIYEVNYSAISSREIVGKISSCLFNKIMSCIRDSSLDDIEGWKIDILFPPKKRKMSELQHLFNSRRN